LLLLLLLLLAVAVVVKSGWWWLVVVVMVGGGLWLTWLVWWDVVVVVVVGDGQRVDRGLWRFVWQFVFSRDMGIIYCSNIQILTCPVGSAGWCIILQGPKGSKFNSHCEHLFLKYD
jgi:hypothetical protein